MLNGILEDAGDALTTEIDRILIDDPESDLSRECQDLVHEIADDSVPIYYYEQIECARDNMDLATTVPELGPAFGGEPTACNIIAANIYEKLVSHLHGVLEECIDTQYHDQIAENRKMESMIKTKQRRN